MSGDFNKVEPLRNWVQFVLPLVYDDSLSYLEKLSKIQNAVNQLIENNNNLPAYIVDIIDEKLHSDDVKKIIQTIMQDFMLNVKFPPAGLTPAVGDGTQDDSAAIAAIVEYAKTNNKCIFFPNGNYLTAAIDLSGGVSICGQGRYSATITLKGGEEGSVIYAEDSNYYSICNIGINGNSPVQINNVDGINITCAGAIISDIYIKNCYTGLIINDSMHFNGSNIAMNNISVAGLEISGTGKTAIYGVIIENMNINSAQYAIKNSSYNSDIQGILVSSQIPTGIINSGNDSRFTGTIVNSTTSFNNTAMNCYLSLTGVSEYKEMKSYEESFDTLISNISNTLSKTVLGASIYKYNGVQVQNSGNYDYTSQKEVTFTCASLDVGASEMSLSSTNNAELIAGDMLDLHGDIINIDSVQPFRYKTPTQINSFFSGVPAQDGNGNNYTLLTAGADLGNLGSDFYNVKTLGAAGDGVTDDSDVFISVFSGGNKNILIPPGSYKLTKSIPVYSNTRVICYGKIIDNFNTVEATQDKPVVGLFNATNQTNIFIDGINVEGVGYGTFVANRACLNFSACRQTKIVNGIFNGIRSCYVVRFDVCNFSIVKDCYINKYSYIGIGNVNGGDNCTVDGCTLIDLYVDSSYSNTYPIMINGYEDTPTENTHMGTNLICTNNYIKNSNPFWESIDAHGGTNVVIQGNICDNVYDGIALFGSASDSPWFRVNYAIISGNIITCSTTGTQRSVAAHGISADGYGLIIDSNVIKFAGALSSVNGAGIYSRRNENSKITNNLIIQAYDYGMYIGISKNLLIENNYIASVLSNRSGETYCMFFSNSPTGEYYANTAIRRNQMGGAQYFWQGPNSQRAQNYQAYVGFDDNVYLSSGQFIRWMFVKPDIIPSGENVSQVQLGRQGDIIRNYAPASGAVWAWVCTLNPTSSNLPTWTPIATLP